MITISKQDNGVLFTFENSDKYLYGNGTIEVPFNSLSIITDESDMITLRKSASNDIFLSARYDTDLGYRSKDDAIDDLKGMLFAETGGGGSESGITSGEVQTMIDNSLRDYYTDDEVDAALSGKASASDVAALQNEVAAKADTSAVTAVASDVSTLSGQVATKVAITDFNTYSAATDSRLAEDEEVTAAALNDLQENKADTSAVTAAIDAAISGKADTSAVTAVNDALTAHTSDTDIHVTTAQTAAWNAKQDALSAGTGIEISGNVISATGGGGATYSAGTNISIDTANTINCTLPITAGTNELTINTKQIKIGTQATGMTNGFSFAMGDSAKASQHYTFAAGTFVEAKGYCSQSFGQRVYSNNHNEFSCGKFNDSVTGSTASGQTLFSVGNGENYTTNKHNALEIRQNGDIYFPDTDNTTYQNDYQKPMVRLQDMYGALGGLKLVKLTQSEYDQLATKDPDTLYIITNVVS